MFPRRKKAKARLGRSAALLLAALAAGACGSPVRASTKPKPLRASTAVPAAHATHGFELVDPGLPPRQQLVLALEPGQGYGFKVSQQLRLIQRGVEQGSVLLDGPLYVNVAGAHDRSFQLSLELGPISVQQHGDTAGISLPPAAVEEAVSARVTARVRLGVRGQLIEQRVPSNAEQALLMPLLETLLHLNEFPAWPVGTGARWRTLRVENGAGVRTESEHELLELGPLRGTLRVWRQQATVDAPSATSRARGEWSWSRDRWPFTGVERTSFDLPGRPDAVVSVSFQVVQHDQ